MQFIHSINKICVFILHPAWCFKVKNKNGSLSNVHSPESSLMPLEYLTPQFEKVNMFCRSPPVARSTYCRTSDRANDAWKNDVIQLWKDRGAGGRVVGEGSRGWRRIWEAHIWHCVLFPVGPVGLYVQGSRTLGTWRSWKKHNPWTLKKA